MFYVFALTCFIMSMVWPLSRVEAWEPSIMGPIVICSTVCSFFLWMQIIYYCRYGNGLFWGKMFVLWSIFHMIASLAHVCAPMFEHFLWIFSAACWQITDQIYYGTI